MPFAGGDRLLYASKLKEREVYTPLGQVNTVARSAVAFGSGLNELNRDPCDYVVDEPNDADGNSPI